MDRYRALVDAHVEQWITGLPPGPLYAPMAYLMQLPAKRVRPVLTLMACELFGGRSQDALDEALGVELFHNFTLMHDDIMDHSPIRRGLPTVHVKWDVNTAILSGDAMLVKANGLMGCDARVLALFNRAALEVCEGQQLDMDFERRNDVTVDEYRSMIRLKTAVLLSCALQVGATVANASRTDIDAIGRFGEQLGLAFQLRDDVLDAFGDPGVTGKQRGGDLRAGKKTGLLIRGVQVARENGRPDLKEELDRPKELRNVERMIRTLEELGVRQEMEAEVERYETQAIETLESIAVEEDLKAPLLALAEGLMDRRS